MPTGKQYDHPYEYEMPVLDELAICIAFLQSAKIRAEKHISNPFTDTSWLEEPEQELIDVASEAIDLAVVKLEALRNALKRDKDADE